MIKLFKEGYDSNQNFKSNSYAFTTKKCNYLIDPSNDVADYKEYTQSKFVILITHGHFDHLWGVNKLINNKNCLGIFIHQNDWIKLDNPNLNYSIQLNRNILKIENKIKILDIKFINDPELKIVHSPGHTNGSVFIFKDNEKAVFTGDTFSATSISKLELCDNLESFKKTLNWANKFIPNEYIIYGGHGPIETMGFAKKYNHYFNEYAKDN